MCGPSPNKKRNSGYLVMETPAILFLNGASGAGKTAIASELSSATVQWIHPDGLWDTPSIDQRELTFKAVQEAMLNYTHSELVVIDSQLKHQFMLEAFREHSISRGKQILLHCMEVDLRQRLEERGWEINRIEAMESWAQYLFRESTKAGNLIIDTSENTIDEVVFVVNSAISGWGWSTGF